ncbi:hypothetical protein AZ22_0836 [Bordetella bronchiseptica 980-2]|nr:hypothetical protein AZ22_0836 [Bordetella bronchiseptica 980-2]
MTPWEQARTAAGARRSSTWMRISQSLINIFYCIFDIFYSMLIYMHASKKYRGFY